MRHWGKRGQLLVQGTLIGVAVFLATFLIWTKGWLETWEHRAWDLRAKTFAEPASARDDIVLVLVDQNSIDWTSENNIPWPWPKEFYGALLSFFERGGAKSVTFDILFDGDSALGVHDDLTFGQQIALNRGTVLATFLGKTAGPHTVWPESIPPSPWPTEAFTNAFKPTFPVAQRSVFPIPELSGPATLLGNIQAAPDADNIFRRIPLFAEFDGHLVPALGLAAALATDPEATIQFRRGHVQIDERSIPVDPQGNAILRFHGPFRTFSTFTAASILQSEIRLREGQGNPVVDPSEFKDKYIFVGYSAPGLFDYRPTPMGGTYPGVGIHATLLDNFLSERFMQKVPVGMTLFLLALICAGGGIGLTFAGNTWAGAVSLVVLFGFPVAIASWAYAIGWWLPLVVLQSGAVMTAGSALITSYTIQGRQQRFIRNAFQQYLSPAVIEELVRSPDRLKLGGEYRELSIFFSDLSGFTTLSEGLEPAQLTALLNEYLTAMTDLIMAGKGTIDKYEGDAIIAFWNAPVNVPDHPVRAVRAALLCQKKLAEMRADLKTRFGSALHMRIGINTGAAIVGNLGSTMRFDYSMLGDAVNLAARLEGVNKAFGTETLISGSTREAIGEAFQVREIARVAVVGRRQPVTLYEPMFEEEFALRKDSLAIYGQGLELFYQGQFSAATGILEKIKNEDPCAAALIKQCQKLILHPPLQWKGVWKLTEK